jgi:hypothetical protein
VLTATAAVTGMRLCGRHSNSRRSTASRIEGRGALKEWRQLQEIADELLTDQHFTAVVALFNDQPVPPHP